MSLLFETRLLKTKINQNKLSISKNKQNFNLLLLTYLLDILHWLRTKIEYNKLSEDQNDINLLHRDKCIY